MEEHPLWISLLLRAKLRGSFLFANYSGVIPLPILVSLLYHYIERRKKLVVIGSVVIRLEIALEGESQ